MPVPPVPGNKLGGRRCSGLPILHRSRRAGEGPGCAIGIRGPVAAEDTGFQSQDSVILYGPAIARGQAVFEADPADLQLRGTAGTTQQLG
jgi:hypothetical protein